MIVLPPTRTKCDAGNIVCLLFVVFQSILSTSSPPPPLSLPPSLSLLLPPLSSVDGDIDKVSLHSVYM